jgi:hypothetical protein
LANVPVLTIVSKQEPEIKQANVVEHEIQSEDDDEKESAETN